MKKILLSIVAVSLFACQEKEQEQTFALVSGNLENHGGASVTLYDPLDDKITIEVANDGTFLDTVLLNKPGYYTLRIGRDSHKMYLAPGQDIAINADISNKDAQPLFTGTAAASGAYFAKQKENIKSLRSNYAGFFGKEEAEFSYTLDSLKNVQMDILNKSDLSQELVDLETKAIEFERLDNKLSYIQAHPYYSEKESFTPSNEFQAELDAVNFDNEENAVEIPAYRAMAYTNFNIKINEMYDAENSLTMSKIIDVIKETQSPTLRNEFAKNSLYFMSPGEENLEEVYKNLVMLSNSDFLTKRINEKYDVIKNLVKGKPSPTFDYENFKGGNTALADLKGKYVYIDVWATWCGPCIGEIPSLQAIEEKFHDSNVEFVSISIDEKPAYDKWRSMVTDKNLGGEQLMADNAWQSQFIKSYGIDGIPRFILLDPEGNIVNADAQRPSNPDLENTFRELGL